jgi:hypothetical protein
MAKANRPTTNPNSGPFLDAAFICEQLLKEKDGAYSAIRMVNRINFHEQTFDPGTIVYIPLSLIVTFKGDTTGTRQAFLYVTNPSGKRELLGGYVFPHPLEFTGGDTGPIMILRNLPITYEKDGTYWIDIFLERKRFSRIPLTVRTNQPPKALSGSDST